MTSSFTCNTASQIASRSRSNDAYAWSGAVAVNRAYANNGLNQHTQSGSIALGYDGRGNLTSSGATTYGYSAENRLASVFDSGGLRLLSYDALGRLARTNGSASTYFEYSGSKAIREFDGATGAVLRRYVYGPGTDEPLTWYEGAGTTDKRFLHADERGSIVAISNASGTVTNINSYDEYGIPASTNLGRFQYTGQAWIPELGMYYYKARIYSPTLGRFLQSDPIGYGDGPNLYAYVGGDPVNRRDPSGLAFDLTSTGAGSGPDTTIGSEIVITGARPGDIVVIAQIGLPFQLFGIQITSQVGSVFAQGSPGIGTMAAAAAAATAATSGKGTKPKKPETERQRQERAAREALARTQAELDRLKLCADLNTESRVLTVLEGLAAVGSFTPAAEIAIPAAIGVAAGLSAVTVEQLILKCP